MSTLTRWPLSHSPTAALLRNWNLGKLLFLRAAPGTASPSVVVTTPRGQFLLKQRSPRYSSAGWLAYDHAVMAHLARAGLPVHPALKTPQGSRWVREGEQIYEIYPWVEGEDFHPGRPAQIEAAGELLACLHQATAGFTPAGRKRVSRLFDPRDRLAELAEARELLEAEVGLGGHEVAAAAALLAYLEEQLRGILERLPDRRFHALPQVIVHGDYHPANLKFRGDQVVGLFDFDWTCRQPRLKDVADGLLFFAPRERPLSSDLTSLTQAPRFDLEQMKRFLRPYLEQVKLSEAEWGALPDLLRERWLYVRLDAMHRKVPREEKLRFLLPEVDAPLRWLDMRQEEMLRVLREA